MGYKQPCIIGFLNFFLLFCISPECCKCINSIVLSIPEEVPTGTKIGMLPTPGSSIISGKGTNYMIVSDEESLFKIDSDGSVVVAKVIDLEVLCSVSHMCCSHSAPCELPITVIVEDQTGNVESIKLNVRILDINDNAPRFRNPEGQTIDFSEKEPVGAYVSLDPAIDQDWSLDNQVKQYILHGEELQQTFEISDSSGRDVLLKLREPLDYERQRSFNGSLEACDISNCTSAPLTVNVVDVNDNLPFFLPPLVHNLTITEDFPVNQVILQLNATDKDSPPNAQIRYEMKPTEDETIRTTFRLNPVTGVITLAQKLRAEIRRAYRFQVRVKEGENSRTSEYRPIQFSEILANTADILINVQDINDYAPEIQIIYRPDEKQIEVPENAAPTKVLTLRVRDRDLGENGIVTCSLTDSSESPSFALERTTDSMIYTVHSLRSFDAEIESALFVNISCEDSGTPRQRTVKQILVRILDKNEYVPTFSREEYSATVTENAPADVFVIQVQAYDRDHAAQLVYSLKGDGEGYFKIDPENGKISTIGDSEVGASRLDREITSEITFHVLVMDSKPQATTADGYMNNRYQLDKDLSEQVVYTAQATVTVKVLDENDNAPTFTAVGPFYLPENQPKYTKVNGYLNAIDPDAGLNGKVKYTLQEIWYTKTGTRKFNTFRLDEITGELQALEVLDREQIEEYMLSITACDMPPTDSQCSQINVTVSVIDANDNTPEWLFPVDQTEKVNVTSDAKPGQIVAQLVAHDRDSGQNGRVRYSLHDPHSQVAFTVNSSTGQVTVADRYTSSQSPDSAEENELHLPQLAADSNGFKSSHKATPSLYPGVYRLRLRASDLGHPQLHADTWLTIHVVGTGMGILGIQTGLLVLLVLITTIIAICLTVAIICVRRHTKQSRNCEPCCLKKPEKNSNARHQINNMTYVVPPDHGNCFEYPTTNSTFMKQSSLNHHYNLIPQHVSANVSAFGGDNYDRYHISDSGVDDFYSPYHKQPLDVFIPQDVHLNPEQLQILENQMQMMSDHVNPSIRSGSNYSYNNSDLTPHVDLKYFQSLKYSTRGETGSPVEHPTSAFRLLSFPEYNGCGNSPTIRQFQQDLHFCKRMNDGGQEVYEFKPNGTIGLRQNGILPSSEIFEGGSADSGRGVSEDEPQLQFSHADMGASPSFTASSFQTSTFCPSTSISASYQYGRKIDFQPNVAVPEEFNSNENSVETLT